MQSILTRTCSFAKSHIERKLATEKMERDPELGSQVCKCWQRSGGSQWCPNATAQGADSAGESWAIKDDSDRGTNLRCPSFPDWAPGRTSGTPLCTAWQLLMDRRASLKLMLCSWYLYTKHPGFIGQTQHVNRKQRCLPNEGPCGRTVTGQTPGINSQAFLFKILLI